MIHENTDIPGELAFDFITSKTDNSETVNDCSSEVDEIKETPDQKSCISELLLNLLHDDSVKNLLAYVNMPRVIVTIEKLKELKGETCREMENDKVCGSIMTYNSNEKGSVFILSWSCPRGHAGIWRSSEVLKVTKNNNVYVNDILIPAAVVLSGSQYYKFSNFCQAMNLQIPSGQSYLNYQKHFIAPTVAEFWDQITSETRKFLAEQDVCLLGDGRSDSPGHSAKYCTYIMMDSKTEVVVDMQIVDKRETKGVSTNMEVFAAEKLLVRLKDKMLIAELVTDASTTVAKRVDELKGRYQSKILKIWVEFSATMEHFQVFPHCGKQNMLYNFQASTQLLSVTKVFFAADQGKHSLAKYRFFLLIDWCIIKN